MSDNDDCSKQYYAQKKLGTRHLQIFLMLLGVAITFAGRFGISVAIVGMTDPNSTNTGYPLLHINEATKNDSGNQVEKLFFDHNTYNWDSEEKAIILSSFSWSYVIMQIPSGIIADVYSAHKLLCFGVFISNLVNVITPLSVYYFGWTGGIVCRVLMGFTQSCLVPCSHTFISRWVPMTERSRLGSLAMIGAQFGNVISLMSSGWLASSPLGWPSIFYVFGVLSMLWAVLFYYVGADSPSEHEGISHEERNYIESNLSTSTTSKAKVTKIPWKSMITSIPLWSLIITTCGHSWGFQIFLNKLPAYIKYGLGYDIGQSGVISGLPYVATILMTFAFGWLCDLALKNSISLSVVRKVSNSIGMWGYSAALLGLCLLPTEGSLVPLGLLIVIFGLDAANYCGFHMNHIDIAPNYAGAQIAIFNATGVSIGQAAILTCGYIVTDETNINQWHIIFYMNAGCYFLANLIFVIFGQTQVQSWNSV